MVQSRLLYSNRDFFVDLNLKYCYNVLKVILKCCANMTDEELYNDWHCVEELSSLPQKYDNYDVIVCRTIFEKDDVNFLIGYIEFIDGKATIVNCEDVTKHEFVWRLLPEDYWY